VALSSASAESIRPRQSPNQRMSARVYRRCPKTPVGSGSAVNGLA